MEFNISENFLSKFIPHLAVERNHHSPSKRFLHEALRHRVVITHERSQILRFRTEPQGHRKLKQKPDMEIAEVSLYGIKKKYASFSPFV
jgi:hypothetical protein